MSVYQTEQEKFWAGSFGQDYIARNKSDILLASNLYLFSQLFSKMQSINTVLEFGANIGMNLRAIRQLLPKVEISALEINSDAAAQLKSLNCANVYIQSMFDFILDYQRDFVFTKGVLIHLSPDYLQEAYRVLYESSSKYICIAEYYNPTPMKIPYRDHEDRLFKRDFCGEMLEKYPDLKFLDYGFCYHRDPHFPQDDITWFLMEK